MTKHHTKKGLKKKHESMTDRRQIQREGKNKQSNRKKSPTFLNYWIEKKKYVRFDIILEKLKGK